MQAKRGASVHLDIPFYRQHYEFTCGPASLMMAMKYFDKDLRLGKDLEINIWREGNLIEVHGTSRYGLAYSAAVRGFNAKVTSNTGGIDFVDKLVPPRNDLDIRVLKDQFYERRARCRNLGVRESKKTITGELISKSLSLNQIPIIVTDTLLYSEEDLPHWVVVTGIDEKFLYFNNPSDKKHRKRKFEVPDLQEFIGYRGNQSMVEVWKQ